MVKSLYRQIRERYLAQVEFFEKRGWKRGIDANADGCVDLVVKR